MLSNKIISAIRGSLSDLQRRVAFNWSRSSPCLLELEVNGSYRLQSIPAYRPAIYEDGSFLLEPVGFNGFTWSQDLTQAVWIKGSNVQVRKPPERPLLPDGSGVAQEINWFNGVGNTQKLQRTFTAKGATDYILKFIVQPRGGRCGANDVIQVIGGTAATAKIQLSSLNEFQGKYRILELKFRSAGTQPTLPATEDISGFTITAVTSSTFTFSGLSSMALDALLGGQVYFTNAPTVFYLITGNTALANGVVTVTVGSASLVSNGVTTARKALFVGAPDQTCTLELYSESVFSLLWGDVSLQEGLFSSSFMPQDGEQAVRAAALLEAQPKDNPLRDLRSFGVYGKLRSWVGNGNLIDFGDFKIRIEGGKLQITAGTSQIQDPDPLPTLDSAFFVMVGEETSSISLFVNGVLKNRASLSNFRPSSNPVIFSSRGIRVWHTIVCFGQALLDGKPELGGVATQEVSRLFSEVIVPASLISSQLTTFELPPVKVPGASKPTLIAAITGVNTATRRVTISSTTGFVVNDSLAIVRGKKPDIINSAVVEAVFSAAELTLSAIAGVQIGDSIYKGNFGTPGRAFVRFPFVAIDEQRVLEVTGNQLRLTSSLSFIPNLRAIVRNDKNQDITEIMVTAINISTSQITVSDASKIQIGHLIAQTLSETRIDWQLYSASFRVGIPGVRVGEPRSQNGILIENTTPVEVSVTARIEAFL